ncbi:DUF58 domain-containing protein [Halalkalibacter kiskunsagensis]|uniref:DUF58 domain-containing protein n=1 Tax=Halalkalibacter kiskunsagensis TaxID=1548599 RepID=A0ABV6KH32_9BACI
MNIAGKVRSFLKYMLLLIFVVATFSYAMFQGGFVSWFLFYSVLTVIICTVLIAIYPFSIKKVERKLSKEVLQAGEKVEVTVTIHKQAFQPFFFVRVQDIIPEKLGTYHEAGALFFFSFQKRLVFSYSVHDVKRGSHTFQQLSLVFGDLFGLFERVTVVPCETTVLVYPHFYKINEIPANGSPKQLEGQRVRQSFEEDRSLSGVRGYVPGDRLTSIDWKQSARSAKLMTKEFESYQGEGVLVAFDSFLLQGESYFEHSIELAASLLVMFAKKQTSPILAVRLHDWVAIEVTQQQVFLGLKLLAKVTPNSKATPIVHKMYREWRGMHVYYVCIELNEQLRKTCQTILEQGANVTICVVAVSPENRNIVKELEKLGITIFIEKE